MGLSFAMFYQLEKKNKKTKANQTLNMLVQSQSLVRSDTSISYGGFKDLQTRLFLFCLQ